MIPVTPDQRQRLLADHPGLTAEAPLGSARISDTVQNVRAELKTACPTVHFRLKSQVRRSGASELRIEWTQWPDEPSPAEVVNALVKRWRNAYSTTAEAANLPRAALDELREQERFRAVFGGFERILAGGVEPTPEQRARYERRALNRVLDDTLPALAGDGTAVPARLRQRL